MAFEGLSEKLDAIFKRLKLRGKLKESDVREVMREVRLALLEADVHYKVAKDFTAACTERAIGAQVMESLTPAMQVIKIVKEEMTALMGGEPSQVRLNSRGTTVIMLCGLQGSGKTTHCAKLAVHFKAMGRRVSLAACDVYRPAAVSQLKIVGEQAGVFVFEMGQGDPVEIAKKALARARDYGDDILIVDTAGRLHVDDRLMAEIEDIKNAVNPDEILLVVDAMTGQDAVNAAKAFDERLAIDGIILTKLDGDTRGGAALSIRAVTGKPVKFAGTGEKLDKLELFYPERMASRILGMGDMITLIEKAQSAVDEKKAAQLEQKMRRNAFTLSDLLEQMKQLQGMGPLGQVLGMIPGVKLDDEDTRRGEQELKRFEAIINSMTPSERQRPGIIDPKRKRRIAAGSGTKVQDVNRVLRQFEQMQKMLKQMNTKKGRAGLGRMGLPF